MKVQVNNKEVEMTPASTLTQLAAQLELPVQGIAIAVDNATRTSRSRHCYRGKQQNDSPYRMGGFHIA